MTEKCSVKGLKKTQKDGKGNILIAHLRKLTHKASFKIFKTLKKAEKAVILTKLSYLNNLTFLRFILTISCQEATLPLRQSSLDLVIGKSLCGADTVQ